MKSIFCTAILIWASISNLFSQKMMYIHLSTNLVDGLAINKIDSMYFSSDGVSLRIQTNGELLQYALAKIDSITFAEVSTIVSVDYQLTKVRVINPFVLEGVEVTINNMYVAITNTSELRDITYALTGNTSQGNFKLYGEKRYNLLLNGVSITNPTGPAINLQSKNKCTITLSGNSAISDGASYSTSTEDQKGAFFSEGQLLFNGTGTLNITAKYKHALSCDDGIIFEGGTLKINSAKNDGINSNEYFIMSAGTINMSVNDDGINSGGYVDINGGTISIMSDSTSAKGITSDSTLQIKGGQIQIDMKGKASKALKSDQQITLTSGSLQINMTGNSILEVSGSGFDPSYSTAISSDQSIIINGAININIKNTGLAGKGISADQNISISLATINVSTTGSGATYKNSVGTTSAYSASCITADGSIFVQSGNLTLTSSGSGGKGMSTDGKLKIGDATNVPEIKITTSGVKFIVSGSDYSHPKALRSNGPLTIENGLITISSSDDAIHSDTSITINKGEIKITNSVEGIESPSITVNDGTINLVATDDGFNGTYGTVAGGSEQNDRSQITVNGGSITVSTSRGDGFDGNGNITINGGTIIVHGPPSSPEESIDVNGTFNINGGFLIASGTNANMNKAMSTTSLQNGIFGKTSSVISAGTILRIQDSNAKDIVTFKPERASYSFHFSSSALVKNSSYSIYTGGTCTGNVTNGLYSGGTYSGGTLKTTFTITSTVTSLTF